MCKNRCLTLTLSGILVVAATVGEVIVLNGVANAATPLGSLTFTPSSGSDQALFQVKTTVGCPNPNADAVFMTVTGPIRAASLTFDHFNIVTTTNNGFDKSGPMDVGIDNDLISEAGNNGTQLATGEYDFDLVCTNSQTLDNLGDFTGVIHVDENAHSFTAQRGGTLTPTSTQTPTRVTPSPTAAATITTTPSPTENSAAPNSDTPTSTASSGGAADNSASAASGSTNTSAQIGSRSKTGAPIPLLILFGLIVFVAGLVLVVVQRRRKGPSRDGS